MTGSLSVCILFGLIPIHSDGLFITTYLHDLTKKNSILLVLKILAYQKLYFVCYEMPLKL